MKKLVNKLAVIGVLMAVSAPFVWAESPVELGAGVDVVSDYVWRGQLLTDDPVIQPSIDVGAHGFNFNAWGSIDMTDVNENGGEDFRLQEVDYTLSYGFSPSEGVDLEVGAIYYDFPGTGFDSTQEVYLSAGLSSLPLSPTATVYYDIDEIEGVYANIGIGHTFELQEDLGLSLGASLGWGDEDYNAGYFGVNDSGLNDLGLSASLDYTINENFSVSVYTAYSEMLDSDIEDAVADSDTLYGGIGFYFSY
ncbi:MAG: TorF family putative porin [Lentisphaeria bacterium]